MLEIAELDVSIGSVAILRGCRSSCANGQFVGLIGRNGAGKTTLMRAIMGILPARGGTIRIDGATRRALPTHDARGRGSATCPRTGAWCRS